MSGYPDRRDYGNFNRGRESRGFYDRDRPERGLWGQDPFQGAARSPPRRHHYKGRDEEGYGTRRAQRRPARESNILILRGIPKRFTEQQIEASVSLQTTSYEQLTLFQTAEYTFSATAEARSDGRSETKNSAVLRFATVQEAQEFLSNNPRGLAVQKYHISLFFGSGHEDGFWSCSKCTVVNHETRSYCLQCGVLDKPDEFTPEAAVNTGESDIGFAPSHVILMRGLDTLTTEEDVYSIVRSIAEVCRIWLVKDRLSRVSCGFGFLEFPSQMVASGFISTLSSTQHGYIGLRIGGKWATPCYAHPQSLAPAPEPSDWTVWGTDGAPYQYWDFNLCLSEFPAPQPVKESLPPDFKADLEAFDAFVSDPPKALVDLPGTVSAEPVSFQSSATKKLPQGAAAYVSSDEPQDLLATIEATATLEENQISPQSAALDESEVLDYTRRICRLCRRQFRQAKDLDKHKGLSQLHKKNLQDEGLIQKLLQSKANRYRDRIPAPESTEKNIGSRLLSKMGWKEGQGLGKDGSGIREPIRGTSYSKGAGIGSGVALPSDPDLAKYHDRGKQMARARYLNE